MTRKELLILLEKEHIPKHYYSLEGGLPNDALCLNKINSSWVVYYSEMGEKYNEIGFPSEESACEYFYNKLKDMIE